MKRLFLTVAMVATAAWAFHGLHRSAAQLRAKSGAGREEGMRQARLLEQVRRQRAELTTRIGELQPNRLAKPPLAPKSELADIIATNRSNGLAPELRERLLAELGFDWNSMPDHLVVSKETLRKVGVEAMRGRELTDTVCGVLAITPKERAEVEALAERLGAEFDAWSVAHVQRAEPEGNVLAQYLLPPDPEFSQSLSNAFSAGLMAGQGAERGELLLGYARSWMGNLAMCGGTSLLTVKRSGAADDRLELELQASDGSSLFTDISPKQPFPEAFRAIFPNGWAELAWREGFELPKAFQKKPGGQR